MNPSKKWIPILSSVCVAAILSSGEPARSEDDPGSCVLGLDETHDPCQRRAPNLANPSAPETTTYLPERPSYFFKKLPNTDFAAVIGEGGNYLANLKTKKTVLIPGFADPVPSPDGRLLTLPDGYLRFYALQPDGTTRIAYRDRDINETYQSVGMPESGSDQSTYRVVVQRGSIGIYRDYTFKNQDMSFVSQGPIVPLCQNLKGTYQLPMVSKDGKRIALYDINEGSTEIYDIDGENCVHEVDLHMATGKVDFSPDGNRITFHAPNSYRSRDDQGSYFDLPRDAWGLNVFVYDFKTGKTIPVTNNQEGNSYYPTFNDNSDTVLFLNQDQFASPYGRGFDFDPAKSPYSLVQAKIIPERGVELPGGSDQCSRNPQIPALIALGKLWSEVCLNTMVTVDSDSSMHAGPDYKPPRVKLGDLTSVNSSILRALSLDHDRCEALVKQCWGKIQLNWKAYRKIEATPAPTTESAATVSDSAGTNSLHAVNAATPPSATSRSPYGSSSSSSGSDQFEVVDATSDGFDPNKAPGSPWTGVAPNPKTIENQKLSDLLAVCPPAPLGSSEMAISHKSNFERRINGKIVTDKDAYEKVTREVCAKCHTPSTNGNLDFSQADSFFSTLSTDGRTTQLDQILLRTGPNPPKGKQMPPEGAGKVDKDLLEGMRQYLKSFWQ